VLAYDRRLDGSHTAKAEVRVSEFQQGRLFYGNIPGDGEVRAFQRSR
jgi:hypothetical protein